LKIVAKLVLKANKWKKCSRLNFMKNIFAIAIIVVFISALTSACGPHYSGKAWEAVDTTIAKIKGVNKNNFPTVDATSIYAVNNVVQQSVWQPAPENMNLPVGTNAITIKHEFKSKIDAPSQIALIPLNVNLEGGKNYSVVAQNAFPNALAWVEDEQGRKVSAIEQGAYKAFNSNIQPQQMPASTNSNPANNIPNIMLVDNAPLVANLPSAVPIVPQKIIQPQNIVQTGVVNNIPVFNVVQPQKIIQVTTPK
jgi:hypothetical protein